MEQHRRLKRGGKPKTPPAPAKPNYEVLPPGWEVKVDPEDGRLYYLEVMTGNTQFTHPQFKGNSSERPLAPTRKHTAVPTSAPTKAPTFPPTRAPTSKPTSRPTSAPTRSPTAAPTPMPTTLAPSSAPSTAPTTFFHGMKSSMQASDHSSFIMASAVFGVLCLFAIRRRSKRRYAVVTTEGGYKDVEKIDSEHEN